METIDFSVNELGKPYHKKIAGKRTVDFNISHSGEFILAVFAVGMDIGVDVQEMAECPDYREIAENFYTAEEAEDVKMKDRICFSVLGGERGICKGAWNWIRKRNGFLLCQKRENCRKR